MSTTRWLVAALAVVVAADLVASSALVARAAPGLARRRNGTVRGPLVWVWTVLLLAYRAVSSARAAGGGVGVCRFEPSCSAYAMEAVRSYGGVRGGALVTYRLLRCQPLSKGGFDPVPARRHPSWQPARQPARHPARQPTRGRAADRIRRRMPNTLLRSRRGNPATAADPSVGTRA